jgi:EmrB/QacA subfamily drug resistance transporter
VKARIFAEESRKWWTLGALAFALFMIMLDNTVVNVALPSIQRDLGVGLTELEWTVNAYALTFAVLMLSGGKLADFFGRRRVFLIGLAIFTLSSLVCGLATTGETLIGARTVQGVGAALMMPATLSIISATFPPHQRGMAIGIWAGVSAMALAIGPLIGGLVTEHIDWGWIFFLNVPIGVLGLIVGRLVIRESSDTSQEQRLDVPGLVASAVALFALTFALIEANSFGWGDPVIAGLFALSAVAFVLFVWLERRQRAPMLDLSLFRSSTFAGANVVAMLVTLAMFGVFFFMSIYMQNVLGYSATETGAAFLPMTVLIILIAPAAGKFSDRVGSRWLMTAGMGCLTFALLVFSRLGLGSTFWDIFPGLVVGGIGMGLVMTPMTAAALGSVPVAKSGVGSGVLNTFRQVGGALGIAVMGAIVAAYVDLDAGGRPDPQAFIDGFRTALEVSAAFAFLGAVIAASTIRKHRHMDAGELAEAAA